MKMILNMGKPKQTVKVEIPAELVIEKSEDFWY